MFFVKRHFVHLSLNWAKKRLFFFLNVQQPSHSNALQVYCDKVSMTTSPQDARLLGHSIFSDCGRGVSLTLWHTASQLTFFLLQLALPQESTLSFIFWGTFKKPKLPIPKNILLKVVLAPCLKNVQRRGHGLQFLLI